MTWAAYGEEPGAPRPRNGYRDRICQSRAGASRSRAPTSPVFLKPRRMAEKALTAVMQEAYFRATRSVALMQAVNMCRATIKMRAPATIRMRMAPGVG